MQFRDLAKQYEILKPQIDKAMMNVASSAHFISGPEVKELEKQLAEYVGVKHCITCANGTDAIQLLCDYGESDQVMQSLCRTSPSSLRVNALQMKELPQYL